MGFAPAATGCTVSLALRLGEVRTPPRGRFVVESAPTLPTVTSVPPAIKIVPAQRMPCGTHGGRSVVGHRRRAPKNVHLHGHWLKVVGVHTLPIPAEMIKRQS